MYRTVTFSRKRLVFCHYNVRVLRDDHCKPYRRRSMCALSFALVIHKILRHSSILPHDVTVIIFSRVFPTRFIQLCFNTSAYIYACIQTTTNEHFFLFYENRRNSRKFLRFFQDKPLFFDHINIGIQISLHDVTLYFVQETHMQKLRTRLIVEVYRRKVDIFCCVKAIRRISKRV